MTKQTPNCPKCSSPLRGNGTCDVCGYDPSGAWIKIVLGLLLATSAVCLGWFYYNHFFAKPAPPKAQTAQAAPSPAALRAMTATDSRGVRDLGQQPNNLGGSQGQALELLDLMQADPGKSQYVLRLITPDSVLVFAADMQENDLARIHDYNTGRRTTEVWNGYIIERLRSAAHGGTLNDTPEGKKMGSYVTE